MKISVKYFASIRESVGTGSEQWQTGAATLACATSSLRVAVPMPRAWRAGVPCGWR